MSLSHFDPNSEYGKGAYRRRIRISSSEGMAAATLDDTFHAMWLLIQHAGGLVTHVEAGIERGPTTVCGGASWGLNGSIGSQLGAANSEITARLPAAANCTHLGDLLRWTMADALRRGSTVYDMTIPDQGTAPVWIDIKRNGMPVHRWLVDHDRFVAPVEFSGRALLQGFSSWAREKFSDSDLQTAIMLQRGAWVARGRRYAVDSKIVPLRHAAGMRNACHSYSGGHWDTATNRLGYVRDFSCGVQEHRYPDHVVEALRGELRAAS